MGPSPGVGSGNYNAGTKNGAGKEDHQRDDPHLLQSQSWRKLQFLPGVPRADLLRSGPPGPVPIPAEQTDLLKMHCPLLPAGNEGEGQGGDALLGPPHAGPASRSCRRTYAGFARTVRGTVQIELMAF